MTDDDDPKPPIDSPEFKAWLKRQTAKDVDAIFGDDYQPADFDERGPIFGDIDNLDKSDAELFPDELEEYTPEERRRRFKIHKSNKNNQGGSSS